MIFPYYCTYKVEIRTATGDDIHLNSGVASGTFPLCNIHIFAHLKYGIKCGIAFIFQSIVKYSHVKVYVRPLNYFCDLDNMRLFRCLSLFLLWFVMVWYGMVWLISIAVISSLWNFNAYLQTVERSCDYSFSASIASTFERVIPFYVSCLESSINRNYDPE